MKKALVKFKQFGHVFDGLVFRTEMSENCYTFFDAGSVVFN